MLFRVEICQDGPRLRADSVLVYLVFHAPMESHGAMDTVLNSSKPTQAGSLCYGTQAGSLRYGLVLRC